MEAKTNDKFARALGDILRERQNDPLGRVSLFPFLETVEGWGYNALRKMVNGERTLQPEAIEAMAAALDIDPRYFREYRRHLFDLQMDAHADLIDEIWDACVSLLAAIDEASGETNVVDQEDSGSGRGKQGGEVGEEQ